MKRSVVAVICLMVVAVVALLWFQLDRPEPRVATKLDSAAKTVPVQNEQGARPSPLNEVVEEEDEFNPYESEVFKAQLQQVADLYEETSKYPINSRPITNPAAVREPEPFEFNEVDLPFKDDDSDEGEIRIAAATDTYQYYEGETINVRVRISGAPTDTFIGVEGQLSGSNGDIPLQLPFQATDPTLTEFVAAIDSKLMPAPLMTTEMTVIINVKVDSKTLLTTVSFRYDKPSAQVVGTLPASVDGPNLVIPLQVNVSQTGYYFVRGVLLDAATQSPLIELQAEAPLTAGNGILNFNAHISALQYHGSEGPYVLRSVKLHRGAETGESYDIPGSSLQRLFDVQGFPFSAYSEEEYVDELAQERLDFLRRLGSVDEEQVREQINQQADASSEDADE